MCSLSVCPLTSFLSECVLMSVRSHTVSDDVVASQPLASTMRVLRIASSRNAVRSACFEPNPYRRRLKPPRRSKLCHSPNRCLCVSKSCLTEAAWGACLDMGSNFSPRAGYTSNGGSPRPRFDCDRCWLESSSSSPSISAYSALSPSQTSLSTVPLPAVVERTPSFKSLRSPNRWDTCFPGRLNDA